MGLIHLSHRRHASAPYGSIQVIVVVVGGAEIPHPNSWYFRSYGLEKYWV